MFLLKGESPQKANLPPFTVGLRDDVPVASQSYRSPYALRPHLKSILDRNMKSGIMHRSSSPWNSPTLLVKKPKGGFRLVCDFRKVNEKILPDNYPLPKIGDLLNNMKKSRYFIMCDLMQGFHQIPITNEAADVLTVGNEFGQFKFDRMPMGVKSAPSYFQRQMDTIFCEMPPEYQLIFMDDLVTHGVTEDETLDHWEEALEAMSEPGLQISAEKAFASVFQNKTLALHLSIEMV